MSNAEKFTAMAGRIEHNEPATAFGGAAVIVFPQGQGQPIEPIELLILDTKGDIAQFLATLVTRLEMVKQEISGNQRFGR